MTQSKTEEFNRYALGNLAGADELSYPDLYQRINANILEAKNIAPDSKKALWNDLAIGAFSYHMGMLTQQGMVAAEKKPAPTDQKPDRQVTFFKITDAGKRKRVDLAQASTSSTVTSGSAIPGMA